MRHKRIKNIIKIIVLFIGTIPNEGCLFTLLQGPTKFDTPPAPMAHYVSSNETNQSTFKYNATQESLNYCPKARVYTIRGLLDVFSTGMDNLSQEIEKQLQIPSKSMSYLEEKRLCNYLIREYHRCQMPIVLIGHSFGADVLMTIAKRLNEEHIPVAILVSLDSTMKHSPVSNVKNYYNVSSGSYVVKSFFPWGAPIEANNSNAKIVNVDLVKDKHFNRVNHFNIDKLPEIHAYIIDIIKSEVPASSTKRQQQHLVVTRFDLNPAALAALQSNYRVIAMSDGMSFTETSRFDKLGLG
jgi:hypothetical protein